MTVTEMMAWHGSTVAVPFDQLTIQCSVADVKVAYGEIRLLVRPLAGAGEQWVLAARVRRLPSGAELAWTPSLQTEAACGR